jgi:23S rRNA (guanosine2251-2'-O)-methyltransferase
MYLVYILINMKKQMNKKKVVILDNIRSVHNVGSIFRTSDALGIDKIFLCGCTPTPKDRFGRARADLAKVALGAEKDIAWEYVSLTRDIIKKLKKEKFQIIAVEQDKNSVDFRKIYPHTNSKFAGKVTKGSKSKIGVGVKPKYPIAIVMGNEVGGIDKKTLDLCDVVAEIPMIGNKESLNVSVSFGIAGYEILS